MAEPLSAKTLSRLIGFIYDCAIDAQRWPQLLDALRAELGFAHAGLAILAAPDAKLAFGVVTGVEEPWRSQMDQYWRESELEWGPPEQWSAHPFEEPAVLTWGEGWSERPRSRYYTDYMVPQGLHDIMVLGVIRQPMLYGLLGMLRHRDAGPITMREVEAGRMLTPHLQRSVAIGTLLDHKAVLANSLAVTLDAVTAGVILIDRDLRIVHANSAAQRLLGAGDLLRVAGSKLVARSPVLAANIEATMPRLLEPEAKLGRLGFGVPVASTGGTPHVIHVLPLTQGELRPGLAPQAVAAIFVAPAAGPVGPPGAVLAALFDLTPAESRVFEMLASGLTPGQIAERSGVSPSTVKSQLLRLFAKTGTRRQAELVQLAASLALPLAGSGSGE